MDNVLTWAGNNWGWGAAILVYLVVNSDKALARLASFVPLLRQRMEERQGLREAELLARIERESKALIILETTLDWMRNEMVQLREEIGQLREAVTSLHHSVIRQNDLITTQTMVLSQLSDELEKKRNGHG